MGAADLLQQLHMAGLHVDVAGSRLIVTPATKGFPVSFKLQYSNDGKAWVDIKSYADYPNPGGRPQKLLFGRTITASCFRILAQKLSKGEDGEYCMQLSEITTLRH